MAAGKLVLCIAALAFVGYANAQCAVTHAASTEAIIYPDNAAVGLVELGRFHVTGLTANTVPAFPTFDAPNTDLFAGAFTFGFDATSDVTGYFTLLVGEGFKDLVDINAQPAVLNPKFTFTCPTGTNEPWLLPLTWVFTISDTNNQAPIFNEETTGFAVNLDEWKADTKINTNALKVTDLDSTAVNTAVEIGATFVETSITAKLQARKIAPAEGVHKETSFDLLLDAKVEVGNHTVLLVATDGAGHVAQKEIIIVFSGAMQNGAVVLMVALFSLISTFVSKN